MAACVRTRRGSHSPALKKDGHGREGLAEVGRGGARGGGRGSTCHTCLLTGDPLHTPSPYPRQLQDSCSLHCCTRGLVMSVLVAADALGIKIFRRERSQGPVGKQRRSAAV